MTVVNAVVLDAVMFFDVAALLYLSHRRAAGQAHKVDQTSILTSVFFVGLIALLLIEMLSTTDAVAQAKAEQEPHGLTVWPQPGRYSLGHAGNLRDPQNGRIEDATSGLASD